MSQTRTNLGIPTDREVPGFHDAAHRLLIAGLNDLYEQVQPGLNAADRLQRLDWLATLAIKVAPDLTRIQTELLQAKFVELYDELVDPVPPEPLRWTIEACRAGGWTPVYDDYPDYAAAHRALQQRLRDDRAAAHRGRHRIVPVYPVIGA